MEKKRKSAWLVSTLIQGLWIAYAFATKQYGFLVPAPFFLYKYYTGYKKWQRDERVKDIKIVLDLPSTPRNRTVINMAEIEHPGVAKLQNPDWRPTPIQKGYGLPPRW
jgi:hypothetical protein